jgi:hypothetical protein
MSTFQNYIKEIVNSGGLTTVTPNMVDLVSKLNTYNFLLSRYDALFNNLFKKRNVLTSELNAIITEMPSLSPNARKGKQLNINVRTQLISNKELISKANGKENAEAVKEILERYIDTISALVEATKELRKSILRLKEYDLALILKPKKTFIGTVSKSSEQKREELLELLQNQIISLTSQKRGFEKVRGEITTALTTMNSKAAAASLQSRLNSLRGTPGAPGISAPQQRNTLKNTLNKIRSAYSGGTRKRRQSHRRHTRRN